MSSTVKYKKMSKTVQQATDTHEAWTSIGLNIHDKSEATN